MSLRAGGKRGREPAVKILRDINVSIERGQSVGVIDESGCGKSTLARVMAGLLPPYQGEVMLEGKALAHTLQQRSRLELQKVQFVYQMADTAPITPTNFEDSRSARRVPAGLGRRKRPSCRRAGHGRTASAVHRVAEELSGGQKQRVNLARALAADPEVLCDEVISALDTIVGANVIDLLKRLRKQTGVSFVFISHDLSTVASFADHIVVLYAGRVVEQGRTDEVLSPPSHLPVC